MTISSSIVSNLRLYYSGFADFRILRPSVQIKSSDKPLARPFQTKLILIGCPSQKINIITDGRGFCDHSQSCVPEKTTWAATSSVGYRATTAWIVSIKSKLHSEPLIHRDDLNIFSPHYFKPLAVFN